MATISTPTPAVVAARVGAKADAATTYREAAKAARSLELRLRDTGDRRVASLLRAQLRSQKVIMRENRWAVPHK